MDTQVCYNTRGSYKCLDIKPATAVNVCPSGFQFDSKIKQCVGMEPDERTAIMHSLSFVIKLLFNFADINECETNVAQCGGLQCVNVPGGYECMESKVSSTKKYVLVMIFLFKMHSLTVSK